MLTDHPGLLPTSKFAQNCSSFFCMQSLGLQLGLGAVDWVKPASFKPSTSQYQLKVDSTTTPANSSCQGMRSSTIFARSLGRRFSATTRHHTVVLMQVNSAVFHLGLQLVKASSDAHFNCATNLGGGRPAR